MIRGWLEPGLIVFLSCHAAAWLSYSVSDAASRLTADLRPHDHFCVHCGQPNAVDFEDLIYRCGSCQGRNSRLMEIAWSQSAEPLLEPDDEPAMSSIVAER